MTVVQEVVNVSQVPQRSPFRYPGGKTWLVPTVRAWLTSMPRRPRVFVEPFAGGAIAGLTVIMEDLADRLILNELDPNVAAVWREIVDASGDALAQRILDFKLSHCSVIEALGKTPSSNLDLAFQTILRNRVQRGGILAPGAGLIKNGENGRGLGSRWYPETLARRIRAIGAFRDRIEFSQMDALQLLPHYLKDASATFFIDPPYTAGGKSAGSRLYSVNKLNHAALYQLMRSAQGDVMMTYDDSKEVRELAKLFDFAIHTVPMKNSHHTEMRELILLR